MGLAGALKATGPPPIRPAGGPQVERRDEDTQRIRTSTSARRPWLVPLNPPLSAVTVHQYPYWQAWTARIDETQRTPFIVGLAFPSQAVPIVWPLPIGTTTVAYEGGTDAGEEILDIFERCVAGSDASMATMLSELAAPGNAEATRGPRREH